MASSAMPQTAPGQGVLLAPAQPASFERQSSNTSQPSVGSAGRACSYVVIDVGTPTSPTRPIFANLQTGSPVARAFLAAGSPVSASFVAPLRRQTSPPALSSPEDPTSPASPFALAGQEGNQAWFGNFGWGKIRPPGFPALPKYPPSAPKEHTTPESGHPPSGLLQTVQNLSSQRPALLAVGGAAFGDLAASGRPPALSRSFNVWRTGGDAQHQPRGVLLSRGLSADSEGSGGEGGDSFSATSAATTTGRPCFPPVGSPPRTPLREVSYVAIDVAPTPTRHNSSNFLV